MRKMNIKITCLLCGLVLGLLSYKNPKEKFRPKKKKKGRKRAREWSIKITGESEAISPSFLLFLPGFF